MRKEHKLLRTQKIISRYILSIHIHCMSLTFYYWQQGCTDLLNLILTSFSGSSAYEQSTLKYSTMMTMHFI